MIWFLSLALATPPTELQEHMQGHFANATDAMWLVAKNDIAGAQREATELAHPPSDALPEDLRPLATGLKAEAGKLAGITDQAEAAQQVTKLTAQCAACHTAAADKGPKLHDDSGRRLGNAEQSHLWGVYGLWIGLVLPDDLAWKEGAALFEPAKLADNPRHAEIETEIATFIERTAATQKALTHPERAAALAGLLTTCTGCHDKLGVPI